MANASSTQSERQIGAPLLTVRVCGRCNFHVNPFSPTCVCGGTPVPVTYVRADLVKEQADA